MSVKNRSAIAATDHVCGAHEAAGAVIQATPKEDKRYAREIWDRRRAVVRRKFVRVGTRENQRGYHDDVTILPLLLDVFVRTGPKRLNQRAKIRR